jgi:glycosyltransferase involved in cell wall biosynthesis
VRIASPHCGLDPETTSGGETYEREVLRHLAALGHVIDIVLARHKRHPEGVANWVIHRLPIARGLRWPVAPLVLPPAIRRLHAALLARRRYGLDVPIVAHHHHLDPSPLNPLLEGRVMRAVERVVVGSRFAVRQAGAALGVPAEQFSVVPYGVDRRFERRERPAALAARLGLGAGPVVLYLGGLKARKNLAGMLAIWGEVARERPAARLVVAGSGPLRESLEREAARLGVARSVVFTGFVPEADKVDHYNVADVLLFPSSMEGFGFSVAEAMSCELPVVTSDRGSLPELVVEGEGGFVCDPARPARFTRALLTLLDDPVLRRKFGAANRERVDRLFRWDHCAAGTARVYEEVLDGWRRRRAAAR